MKRIVIQAEQDLLDRARARASERGVSVAQVFRDALERDLGDGSAPPVPRAIGVGASGRGDLSSRALDDEFVQDSQRSS